MSTGRIAIPTWMVYIIITLLLMVAFAYWYYFLDKDDAKAVGLVGGIVSGLIVFLFTFFTSIHSLLKLYHFEKLGVKNVLTNRHDKLYYASVIKKADKVVRVMGASATRFVDDFLDTESDDKILVEALNRHKRLKVQLLAPEQEYLSEEAKSRLPALEKKLEKLQEKFGHQVELRRFRGSPQHSFVIVDDDLIAGPIFDGQVSKHAPAVHISLATRFAQKYDEHFERVWDASAPRT